MQGKGHIFPNSKVEIFNNFCRFSTKFLNFQKILRERFQPSIHVTHVKIEFRKSIQKVDLRGGGWFLLKKYPVVTRVKLKIFGLWVADLTQKIICKNINQSQCNMPKNFWTISEDMIHTFQNKCLPLTMCLSWKFWV